MQGNIIGQSGMFVNDSLFPIYQQLNQPIEYNGIWIKTEDNLKDVFFQTDDVREYEEVNNLPFSFSGRATSIGSDIYLLGGDDDGESAYKYNSIESTYTKLTDIPLNLDCYVTSVVSNENKIYIASGEEYDGYYTDFCRYNPSEDTYTDLSTLLHMGADGSSLALLEDDLYMFGSGNNEDSKKTYKYNLNDDEFTKLEDIPYAFSDGSAVAINENEIALFGVYDDTQSTPTGYLYIYNITENEYYFKRAIMGKAPFYSKINNSIYLIENARYGVVPILTKYNIKNSSFYQYGKPLDEMEQVVNANNDLFLLSSAKLYRAKIVANYEGDGIYVISQETSLSKDLDVSNVLDVKKIVNEEEQEIIVYVGDGESWKLLNGGSATQNTNALQYALSFKEEN